QGQLRLEAMAPGRRDHAVVVRPAESHAAGSAPFDPPPDDQDLFDLCVKLAGGAKRVERMPRIRTDPREADECPLVLNADLEGVVRGCGSRDQHGERDREQRRAPHGANARAAVMRLFRRQATIARARPSSTAVPCPSTEASSLSTKRA